MSPNRLLHIIIALAASLATGLTAHGQTDPMLSYYFAMPTYYNPAAVGQTDLLRLRGASRLQWVGIDNAPKSFLLTGDMPMKVMGKRIGLGLVMSQESAGLYRNMGAAAQVGYNRRLWKGSLTAAVQIGFANEVFQGSKVFIPSGDDYHEDADDAIPRNDVSGNALDLGLGAFYVHPSFWGGISLRHANQPTITFSDEKGSTGSTGTGSGEGSTSATVKNYEYTLLRQMYFMAGCNIPIKNTLFQVMPSVMVRTDFTLTTAQVTVRALYNRLFSFGLGYRHNDAVSLLLGVDYKNFFFGYSYDYPINEISKASKGSHELMAGYSLKIDLSEKNRNKHKNIRIM